MIGTRKRILSDEKKTTLLSDPHGNSSSNSSSTSSSSHRPINNSKFPKTEDSMDVVVMPVSPSMDLASTSLRPEVIEADPEETFKRVYVEFYRLLHAMEEDEEQEGRNTNNHTTTDQYDDFDWRSVLMRAEMAQGLWKQVAPQLQKSQPERAKSLQARVVRVCQKALERAQQTQSRKLHQQQARAPKDHTTTTTATNNGGGSDGDDPIQRIFSSPHGQPWAAHQVMDDSTEDYQGGDYSAPHTAPPLTAPPIPSSPLSFSTHVVTPPPPPPPPHSRGPPTAYNAPTHHANTVHDLQTAQREQMEVAISGMAAQLKAETQRIHTRLRDQTLGLGQLEQVASDNVDQVTQVTKDVQQQVSSGWKRSIGTWTLFFTLVGIFVVSVMTISLFPKRSGCFLFVFCGKKQPARDTRFCRTLADGTLDCLLDETSATTINQSTIMPHAAAESERHVLPEQVEKDCVMDMNGNCRAPTLDDDQPKEHWMDAVEHVHAEQQQRQHYDQQMHSQAGLEEEPFDAFAHAEPVEAVVGEPRLMQGRPLAVPIYNGRNFGPKEIRKVAGNGELDTLQGYLTVRPDWIDKQDKNGWSALHMAARAGHANVMQYLVEAGCDVHLENKSGQTALDLLVERHGDDHPAAHFLRDEDYEHRDEHDEEEEEYHAETDSEHESTEHEKEQGNLQHMEAPGFDDLASDLRFDGETRHEEFGLDALAADLEDDHMEGHAREQHIAEHEERVHEMRHEHHDHAYHEQEAVQDQPHETEPVHEESPGHFYTLEDVHSLAHQFDGGRRLEEILSTNPKLGEQVDENHWNAFHIAATHGHYFILSALVDAGCDKNIRNNHGQTALDILLQNHGENHPAVSLLRD